MSLCSQCHQRTKYGTHPYCGRACARAARATADSTAVHADNCNQCHQRPKYGTHPYCSKTCAAAARTVAGSAVPKTDLCIQCHRRPKYGTHPYCGKKCAAAGRTHAGSATPKADICIQCHQRPKYGTHPYCGRKCAAASSAASSADKCNQCHQKPKYGTHPYCSKKCAAAAKAAPKPDDCIHCHQRPKRPPHLYCSKACAHAAGAGGQIGTQVLSKLISARQGLMPSRRLAPSNPVVLIHGYCDITAISNLWARAKLELRSMGVEVLVPQLPTTSSIEERSKSLARQIRARFQGKSVHLIGHSMGGLNARDVTARLQQGFRVLSVTTLSTPHRGNKGCDLLFNNVTKPLAIIGEKALATASLKLFGSMEGCRDMTTWNMKKFNDETLDVVGVQYYSWTANYTVGLNPIFNTTSPIYRALEGLNDGLVSVKSGTWGRHLGTLEGVDHLMIPMANIMNDTVRCLVEAESSS